MPPVEIFAVGYDRETLVPVQVHPEFPVLAGIFGELGRDVPVVVVCNDLGQAKALKKKLTRWGYHDTTLRQKG